MQYNDLFIDLDDTIYDTRSNATIALAEVFANRHLDRYFPDANVFYNAYWDTNLQLWTQYNKGEITRDVLILERFRRPLSVGMGNDATEHFCLSMSDEFLELCASKPGVLPGAREALDYLKDKGYRMHICSNGFREIQSRKMEAAGIAQYFDNLILSEDIGYNKPAKEYFDYALHKTGADVRTTLMIGDNYFADIEGAMTVGMDTMLYMRWDKDFVPPRPVTFLLHHWNDIKASL